MTHGVEGLLLASIGGYWVLERASGQKGRVKQVGQLLGLFIIVLSVVGVICRAWCMAAGAGYCPMPKAGMMGHCPFIGRSSPPAPASPQQ